MAAGVTAVVDHGASGNTTANLGTTYTVSVTHAGGGPFLVFVAWRQTSDIAISSVTYDSAGMTVVSSSTTAWVSPSKAAAYMLDDPGSKTADLVVTFAASVISAAVCSMRATGTDATGYIDSAGVGTTATGGSIDVTYSRIGDATFSLHYVFRHSGTVGQTCAPDDGQTEVFDAVDFDNGMTHAFYTLQESAAGSLTRSCTWTSTTLSGGVGVSLAPASAVAARTFVPNIMSQHRRRRAA